MTIYLFFRYSVHGNQDEHSTKKIYTQKIYKISVVKCCDCCLFTYLYELFSDLMTGATIVHSLKKQNFESKHL